MLLLLLLLPLPQLTVVSLFLCSRPFFATLLLSHQETELNTTAIQCDEECTDLSLFLRMLLLANIEVCSFFFFTVFLPNGLLQCLVHIDNKTVCYATDDASNHTTGMSLSTVLLRLILLNMFHGTRFYSLSLLAVPSSFHCIWTAINSPFGVGVVEKLS